LYIKHFVDHYFNYPPLKLEPEHKVVKDTRRRKHSNLNKGFSSSTSKCFFKGFGCCI